MKAITGDTASHYIRRFVIDKAKSMLISGKLVKESTYSLGFDYTPALYPCLPKGDGYVAVAIP